VSSESAARLIEVTSGITSDAERAQPLAVLRRLFDQILLAAGDDRDRAGRAIDTLAYHRKALINAVATGDGIELEFQANEIRERLRLPRTIQHREDGAE
jgi:hypothetical protein